MAKPDWGARQDQFLADHARTGISPKEWCEAQGLKYSTAKRYIKIANGGANSQKKTANKTANLQKGKGGKPRAGKDADKNCEQEKLTDPLDTKPGTIRKTSITNHPPFQSGNQHALKHGGYARRLLLKDEVIEDARALTLEDELFRLRAANLVAAENTGRWLTQIDDASEPEQKKMLLSYISAAEKAMLRNTVRIESITGTLATVGRLLAATDKISLEADKLRRDAGIDDGNGERDLNDFYSDTQTDT
jgi:hypothetical protein